MVICKNLEVYILKNQMYEILAAYEYLFSYLKLNKL